MSRHFAAQIGLHWSAGPGRSKRIAPARLPSVHELFRRAYHSAMSTKHIDTGANVKIECGACGAAKTQSGTDMVKACGAGNLKAIEWRLKCFRCGAKEAWLTVLPPL